MNLEELAKRLDTLEAIEAIKKLKARYCQAADEQDAEAYANLFVEDAVFDGGTFGRAQGRKAIGDFLRNIQQQSLPFAVHYVMNPNIEVAGEQATGRLCHPTPGRPVRLHRGLPTSLLDPGLECRLRALLQRGDRRR